MAPDGETVRRCVKVLEPFLVQDGELDRVAQGGPLLSSSSLDSLALVNLVVALENEFGFQIDTDEIEQVFGSLASLATYLDAKRG